MPDEEVIQVRQPANRVIISSPGPAGPAGPAGPPGAAGAPGGSVFEFTQASPATPWVVNHALNCYPSVTVVVSGEEVDADVVYGSLAQVTISFGSPQSGIARLRP